MSTEDIAAIPIQSISEKNCHLYLWTINKYIPDSYSIAKGWGFRPVCLLTWVKKPHGIRITAGAFIQTTEHLLFCRKGVLKTQKRIPTTWFEHKRLSHSTKPDSFRKMIVDVSGDLPRIELFARELFCGWDSWGNEI